MNICIYGASSNDIDPSYIAAGELLGERLAAKGHSIIYGAGAEGMMGAVARGAHNTGGAIIGIVPNFFNVDGVLFENCTKMLFTDTMRERKALMEQNSDAFVMTPGGIGTFDEFFEILTLRQLCIHTKPIAILNTNGYFDPLIGMLESAMEKKFMSEINRSLYFVSADCEEIIKYIEEYTPIDTQAEKFRNIK